MWRSLLIGLTCGLPLFTALPLLAQDAGKPNPRFVVAWVGETRGVRYAPDKTAQELAQLLEQVTGSTAVAAPFGQHPQGEVVFLVGHRDSIGGQAKAKLEDRRLDAFWIRYPYQHEGQTVCLLAGRDADAQDYPAYAFATRFLDIHWVGPGELGCVWRQQPDWKMPASIDVLDEPDFDQRLWTGRSVNGRHWLAFSSRMGFHHALGYIFRPEVHGDKPEVYPLIKGKRYIPAADKGNHTAGWQPCTSSETTIKIAVEEVVKGVRAGSAAVSLSVNDGAGNTCECDACTALDGSTAQSDPYNLSNRFFTFYNTVVQRAAAIEPRAKVAVLGYGPVSKPPTDVKIDPRVIVYRVQPSPEQMQAWRDAGAALGMYLWLWDGGFFTARPDLQTLEKLVRFARDADGAGLYSEIIAMWAVSAPKFYVLAGLLWDSSRSADDLLREYLQHAYGQEAALPLKSFFDRWGSVYQRQPDRYRTSDGWRLAEQLRFMRETDLLVLDEALAEAEKCPLDEGQRQRLQYLRTWYDWSRDSIQQYLTAKELGDAEWRRQRSDYGVLTAISQTAGLTERFNQAWREKISVDQTGWLLDAHYQKDPQERFWQGFVGQARTQIEAMYETAVADALAELSQRVSTSGGDVPAYWSAQRTQFPAAAGWIDAELRRLRGEIGPNVVTNGSFEDAADGAPPRIAGWEVYEQYGMVHGTTARYRLQAGTGRDGKIALGMGEGRFPELRTFIQLEKDARYTLTFWYRTDGRERDSQFYIYGYEDPTEPAGKPNISRFFMYNLPPTNGQWQPVRQTFVADRTGKYMIMLSVYYQEADQWAWFDDIEIRKQ